MDVDQTASLTNPLTADRAIDDEYRYLHGNSDSGSAPAPSGSTGIPDILRRHERAAHAALCLSGGGVRSASFALGVLQGFARAGVLGDFDYLSTVSGGGYIGGWLSAWRLRDAILTAGRYGEVDGTDHRRRLIVDPRAGICRRRGRLHHGNVVNWMVLADRRRR